MQATIQASRTREPEIHELLARRWSPRAFSARPVEPAQLVRLFQAARWAPSSYNAQPWAFILATREDAEGYNRVLSTLADANRQWAQRAPVLILAVAKLEFDHVASPNRHAFYDLGQAVANLTVDATSLDLYIHQMGGFDAHLARELFAIPAGFEPVAVLALGYLEGPAEPPAARTRKPLADFVFSGSWARPAPLALETETQTRPR
ncbi:MAG: nitroreductase family protein [Acidobacteriia bacterium]|nr:nitroreductase family protein [Terriglobia bacterium]